MEEGEVFLTDPTVAVNEPVLRIIGRYQDIAIYENPILGLLAQSSGICTKSARLVHLARGRMIIRLRYPARSPSACTSGRKMLIHWRSN